MTRNDRGETSSGPSIPPGDEVPRWLRRAIARFFAVAVAILIAYWLVRELRTLLLMVVVALFVSLAMEPAVNALAKRGWRRGAATGLVMLVIAIGGAIVVGAIASIVVQEVSNLVDDAPRYIRDIERFARRDLGIKLDAGDLIKELRSKQGGLEDLANELASSALELTGRAATILFQIVTVVIFAFYMTADGPKLRRTICTFLPPRYQRTVLDTWELAIEKTGGYLYSRALQAVISAFVTWAGLTIIGVPYSLALGIWVGVVSQFIPTVGTYIAMVFPVLIALLDHAVNAIWVLAFLVLYQQFENYVLGPRITARTMHVHPALAIGTVVAGGSLFGFAGAVLALPVTAVIQGSISAYSSRYEPIHTELTAEHRRPEPVLRRLRKRVQSRRGRDVDAVPDEG